MSTDFDGTFLIDGTTAPPTVNPQQVYPSAKKKYSVDKIVKLRLRKILPRKPKNLWKDKTVQVSDATGTVKNTRMGCSCFWG